MMMEAFSLKDKLALITGGGTGLGKAIADCMIQAGARVVIVGRRKNILQSACEELGSKSSFIVYDVTQTEQVSELAAELRNGGGIPDIIVHNAGIHIKKTIAETTQDDLSAMLRTHVLGAYALTQALLPEMSKKGSGHILFITSMAAMFGIPSVSAYTVAKSGISGLVRSLAVELSAYGIRVNAIAPGWIDTRMTQKALETDSRRRANILSRTPMHTLGRPEDIGWAAVYLSSPAARFVTGQQLVIDGGFSIGF
jgi:NAD(P)-dependent dehydrogenase (short-subunit alcohol dehydrogenase family)